jgi:transketolase
MSNNMTIEDVKLLAKSIRISALKMTSTGGSSHIASVLSMTDILAELYGNFMNFDTTNPLWNDRDRFILSKGHGGAGVYASLAHSGFFDQSQLETHYQNGSILSGHVSHKGVPGVEFSTGSLGHGLPVSAGIALSSTTWESALLAAHYNLSNLTVIIDTNKYQSIKTTTETLNLNPFADKWKSFGWDVYEIDGHNIRELRDSLNANSNNRPKCIVANTIKGKGVSFMENNILWHYRSAKGEEFKAALKELMESE